MILIDRLKQVDIDRHVPLFPEDHAQGIHRQPQSPDRRARSRFYRCGSSLNWDGNCNPEVDKLIERQSIEGDMDRRKQLVWAIERKLAEDVARPIIFYERAATCWQP